MLRFTHTDSYNIDSPMLNKLNQRQNCESDPLPSPIFKRFHSTPQENVRSQIDQEQKLRPSEKNLIADLAELFVNKQKKPSKFFIRINSKVCQEYQNNENSRIKKVQICQMNDKEEDLIVSQRKFKSSKISFDGMKTVPELVGIIVQNDDDDNHESKKANQLEKLMEFDDINSQIWSDNKTVSLCISRQVNIGFKPNGCKNGRPTFYKAHTPALSPTTASANPFSNQQRPNFQTKNQEKFLKMNINSEAMTNLVELQLFQKTYKKLKNDDIQHKNILILMLQNELKNIEKIKSQQIFSLKEKLKETEDNLKAKIKQIAKIDQLSNEMTKKIAKMTKTISLAQKAKEELNKSNNIMKKQILELRKSVKEMKQELTFKDSIIRQSKQKLEQTKPEPIQKSLTSTDIQKISNAISKIVSSKSLENQVGYLINGVPIMMITPNSTEATDKYIRPSPIQTKRSACQDSPQGISNIPNMRNAKSTENLITNSLFNSRGSSNSHSQMTHKTGKSYLSSLSKAPIQKKQESGVLMDYMQEQDSSSTAKCALKHKDSSKSQASWGKIMSRLDK